MLLGLCAAAFLVWILPLTRASLKSADPMWLTAVKYETPERTELSPLVSAPLFYLPTKTAHVLPHLFIPSIEHPLCLQRSSPTFQPSLFDTWRLGGPPHIFADLTWNLYLLVGITVAFLQGKKKNKMIYGELYFKVYHTMQTIVKWNYYYIIHRKKCFFFINNLYIYIY